LDSLWEKNPKPQQTTSHTHNPPNGGFFYCQAGFARPLCVRITGMIQKHLEKEDHDFIRPLFPSIPKVFKRVCTHLNAFHATE